MVIFGLLLGLGMLIDGAIVMVEYADRKMAEGLDARDAYRDAEPFVRVKYGGALFDIALNAQW